MLGSRGRSLNLDGIVRRCGVVKKVETEAAVNFVLVLGESLGGVGGVGGVGVNEIAYTRHTHTTSNLGQTTNCPRQEPSLNFEKASCPKAS